MPTSCPACGAAASGKFCSQCGASLEPRACNACGNQVPAGGRFCNMCGTPVPGAPAAPAAAKRKGKGAPAPEPAPAPAPGKLPWVVAGAALVALALAFVIPRFGADPEPPLPAAPPPPAAGNPAAVDLSSMTPREAADRLFDRVMQAVSRGDTTEARRFAPMALSAYGMVQDLDTDGRYHMAAIHLVNGQPAEARATSQSILDEIPSHLFGLFTAAEAEQMLGNPDSADELYQRFLDSYEAEVAAGRPEYEAHAAILPVMRDQATRSLAAR